MKNFALFSLVLAFFTAFLSCKEVQKQQKNSINPLDTIAISEGFIHPESVIYAPDSSFFFISNIGLDETDSTPDGFISKVALDGKIIELKWLDSIRSPKCQVIANGKFYVSALDALLEVDLETGKIKHKHQHDSIVFLNDVCADDEGNVYVSGMKENAIYCLQKTTGKMEKIYQNDSLLHPNGVYWQNNNLYIGTWGAAFDGDFKGYFFQLDLATKELKKVVNKQLGRLDGIQTFGKDFYVSSWAEGLIYKISTDGRYKKILDAEESLGDFMYDEQIGLFVLPQNFQNKVVFIKKSLE